MVMAFLKTSIERAVTGSTDRLEIIWHVDTPRREVPIEMVIENKNSNAAGRAIAL